tara:strand:+ start:1452 stop:2153 length:702 start_codon:yes stop_codon:yes gene_type:complete
MGLTKSLKTILAGIDSQANKEQLERVNKKLDSDFQKEVSRDKKKTSKSVKNLYSPETNNFPAQQTNEDLRKIYDEGLRKKGALTETFDDAGNLTSSSIDVSKLLTGNLKKDNMAMKLYMKHYGDKDLEDYVNNPQMGIISDANTDIAKTILGFNPKQGKVKVSDELSKLYSDRGFSDEISAAARGKYTGGVGMKSNVDYFQGDNPYFHPTTRGYEGTTGINWKKLGYDNNPTM